MRLLGYLAPRFSVHPENLATEALNFILKNEAARRTFIKWLGERLGIELPDGIQFETQGFETNDDSRTILDLIGSYDGQAILLIENKFWAELTDNQPVRYLDRLNRSSRQGALIFIAPKSRCGILWTELRERSHQGGYTIDAIQEEDAIRIGTLPNGNKLAVLDWSTILGACEASSEDDTRCDLTQLRSFCQVMDSVWEPFSEDELANPNNELLPRFETIIDRAVEVAIKEGICSKESDTGKLYKTRRGAGPDSIGHYLQMHDVGFYFHYDFRKWQEFGHPIWIRFSGVPWKDSRRDAKDVIMHRLQSSGYKKSVWEDKQDRNLRNDPLILPFDVKSDVGPDHVVDSLIDQLRELSSSIAHIESD